MSAQLSVPGELLVCHQGEFLLPGCGLDLFGKDCHGERGVLQTSSDGNLVGEGLHLLAGDLDVGVLAQGKLNVFLDGMWAFEVRRHRGDCIVSVPGPIHGMDDAMGLKRSPLGFIVFFFAAGALLFGFGLEWWTSAVDYPVVISGKPFFSYQAYGPVAFALMVLTGAFAALIGMLVLNKLPKFFHPLFYSTKFEKVMDDGFFVSLSSKDTNFEIEKSHF